MKNKHGDLPVTILVIGVFAVCSLALLSFFYSNLKVQNSFVGIDSMEKMNLQIETYLFNGWDADGLYLEKNVTTGLFLWKKEKTVFSVKYSLP